VNRSPHIDKKSREQFSQNLQAAARHRAAHAADVDALMKLDLAAGVDVEIKLA
jgi:small subunit ribosomal protein S10